MSGLFYETMCIGRLNWSSEGSEVEGLRSGGCMKMMGEQASRGRGADF